MRALYVATQAAGPRAASILWPAFCLAMPGAVTGLMNLPGILSAAVLSVLAACSTVRLDPAAPARRADQVLVTVPAEVLNPDVRQDTIAQTICVAGYTATVRPSTTYTNGVKARLLREQGLAVSATTDYELDHRIPLALGGHPRSLANLMLQPWTGEDGARKKDRLERKLQTLVCVGALPLAIARREIFLSWQAAYLKYVETAERHP